MGSSQSDFFDFLGLFTQPQRTAESIGRKEARGWELTEYLSWSWWEGVGSQLAQTKMLAPVRGILFATDIGSTYYCLHKHGEALKYFEQALAMYQQLFPDNPDHEFIQEIPRIMALCDPY